MSYGSREGWKVTGRRKESRGRREGRGRGEAREERGTKASQRSSVSTASRSLSTQRCVTPLGAMMAVPPSCSLEE